ncbi:hypothetical protein C5468_21785 [Photorhabdus luminescens subsp. mexicana]|uniref:Uncharacterized protein n=1 Tax=Photorhabdus luminescens subsp. mexicana TaxID=2100167 RepID=A0A4R4IW73_PHOLU|nr:hypothetical protein C5468_21785 [Photorhabdus luminescens subsp. mexicana]
MVESIFPLKKYKLSIYNQIEPIGDIWGDEIDGIPATISLVGKRCVTDNSQFPKAIFIARIISEGFVRIPQS